MNIKRFWVPLFLLFLILISPADWVEAQEPEGIQAPVETQDGDRRTYDLTWADLLYGEQTLSPGDVETVFDFYLPRDIIPAQTGNYVDLVFSHTAPQTETHADLSVNFNNNLLDIVPLTPENSERASLRFELPGDQIRLGRNKLSLDLNTDLPCGESPATRLIAVIHPESFLHLEYDLFVSEPDLAVYPRPFYERTFLPSEVYFVFPIEPTISDISTAVSISAGLGIYSQGQVQVASVLESELTDAIKQNNHLIVIGRPEANSLLSELDLPFPLDNPLIKDQSGVLQEIVSPWNAQKKILVVTGRSDQALLKAGDVLNRDLNFLGMKGPVAIVEEVLPPSQNAIQREIDITFDSLRYEETTFYGTRPQERYFDFWMPKSWQMTEEAKLFLSLSHSTVIDPETSALNVELNGVPVGSTLLNAENAINGILEAELPAWLLESGRNRLKVDVAMMMGEDICANYYNRQAWTVIRRDSFIHLPYVKLDAAFDLSLFPFPFTENANLTDVSLVLPDVLSRAERDRLLQLAVLLGRQAVGERITLRVTDAEEVGGDFRESNHLILFGQPTNNSLLRDINEYLPQPFEAGTDLLKPQLDSAVLTETIPRDAGLLQELASPWNPEKTILVITGTTDKGVEAAFDLLLRSLPEEMGGVKPSGNLSVIEEQRVYSTDTRLLESSQLSSQREPRVEPVAQPGKLPQRELANRWW